MKREERVEKSRGRGSAASGFTSEKSFLNAGDKVQREMSFWCDGFEVACPELRQSRP